MCDLSPQDSNALAIVRILVDKKKERGKLSQGKVTFNYKKVSVVRGEWRSIKVDGLRHLSAVDVDLSPKAQAAYRWLRTNNDYFRDRVSISRFWGTGGEGGTAGNGGSGRQEKRLQMGTQSDVNMYPPGGGPATKVK